METMKKILMWIGAIVIGLLALHGLGLGVCRTPPPSAPPQYLYPPSPVIQDCVPQGEWKFIPRQPTPVPAPSKQSFQMNFQQAPQPYYDGTTRSRIRTLPDLQAALAQPLWDLEHRGRRCRP